MIEEKKERPFSFFGRDFSRADIDDMTFEEADVWITKSKEAVAESDSYMEYANLAGIEMDPMVRAKKAGFRAAMHKFIVLLEQRQTDLGNSFDDEFFQVVKDNVSPELFAKLIGITEANIRS